MSLDRDGNSFRTDVPGNPPDPASYYERLYGEARAAITLRAENVVLRKMEANLQTRVASLEDENARLKCELQLAKNVAGATPAAASTEGAFESPKANGVQAQPKPSQDGQGLPEKQPIVIPSVTRAEFLKDAAAVLALSERIGKPVAIMHRGKLWAVVSAAVGEAKAAGGSKRRRKP